jgi:hypothetical protein
MRAALAFAFRRGLARVIVGVALVGLTWTGLYAAWPWFEVRGAHPGTTFHLFAAASPWDLAAAAVVLVLGLFGAVLMYRPRPTTR